MGIAPIFLTTHIINDNIQCKTRGIYMKKLTSLQLEEKCKNIREFYKTLGDSMTLIGMNDSQGVNVSSQLLKKTFFHILADAFSDETLSLTAIDTFSLLFNKTEHLDYFLDNNISIEEIKWMQFYSYQMAVQKVLEDLHLPAPFPEFGKHFIDFMKFVYSPKENDDKIHLTDTLKNARQPIFIYSSGVNDLMRAYGNDPFRIKRDYQNRKKTANFEYTKKQVEKQEILDNTILQIQQNFEHILNINPSTHIYTLGAYVPNSLRINEMNLFQKIIIKYNDRLEQLCQQYHIRFINTYYIGEKFNKSTNNFHIEHKGHVTLAYDILDAIDKDISSPSFLPNDRVKKNDIYNINGSMHDVNKRVQKDYDHSITYANHLEEELLKHEYLTEAEKEIERRHIERQYEIAQEHQNEMKVLKKVHYQQKNQ